MEWVLLICGLLVFVVVLFGWAMCRAADNGDRLLGIEDDDEG